MKKTKSVSKMEQAVVGILVALMFIVIMEVILSLAGFSFYPGHFYALEDNDFFVKADEGLYAFDGFEDMFHDQGRYRTQETPGLPQKEHDELRVFIFGGSACHVINRELRYVQASLENVYPGHKITVINFCIGSFSSDRIMDFYPETFQYDPDIIFVHSGNNEFLEPILSKSHGKGRLKKMDMFMLKLSKTYQLLSYIGFKLRMSNVEQKYIEGTSIPFQQVHYECPLDEGEVLQNYRENLEEMCDIAQIHDVPIILSTVTYFRMPESTDYPDINQEMDELTLKGDVQDAIKLRDTISYGPCSWSATPQSNQIVKEVAQNKKIPLADIDEAVIESFPPGTTGYEFFGDHIHYASNYTMYHDFNDPQDNIVYRRYVDQIENGTYEQMRLRYLSFVWTDTFIRAIRTYHILGA